LSANDQGLTVLRLKLNVRKRNLHGKRGGRD
jgi:hypothetical protein